MTPLDQWRNSPAFRQDLIDALQYIIDHADPVSPVQEARSERQAGLDHQPVTARPAATLAAVEAAK